MNYKKEYERELNIAYAVIFAMVIVLVGTCIAYVKKCDEIAKQQYEHTVSVQMQAFSEQVNRGMNK